MSQTIDLSPKINVKEELDEEVSYENSIDRALRDYTNRSSHERIQIQIDDDENDEREVKEDEFLRFGISTVIDLTEDDDEHAPAAQLDQWADQEVPHIPMRNLTVEPESDLQVYRHHGRDVTPGMTVEMKPIDYLYKASFLKIQSIIRTPSDVLLRGLPLTRTRHLRGQLSRLRNELCVILQVDANDERSDGIQAAIQVPVADVLGVRELEFTNADFPEYRFSPGPYFSVLEIEHKALLMCRWKYTLVYKDAVSRNSKQAPSEYVITHIGADEASAQYQVNEVHRLNAWRGDKVRGGSANINGPSVENLVQVVDVEQTHDSVKQEVDTTWIKKQPGQRYSFGDMFSGAGGTSCGAKMAGFRITLACDHAPHANNTHHKNFPQTDLHRMDIYDFIKLDYCPRVDVLHLSPPCQFWSPAHTVEGVNDEANIAVLFSCQGLVKKIRPRVVTFEQTFGILHPRFEHYFNALVRGFTQHGYSVRWKIVNLVNWGLPSRRLRLIMIGSCPGERLPPFPKGTHSQSPQSGDGTLPYVTVAQALRRIPRDASLHDRPPSSRRGPSWNPNVPLKRTITCHGGYGNYHFGGKRDFTLREYATLNGFPIKYEFVQPAIKKQIGNAFPPKVVCVLYKHIREWLEQEDRVLPVEDETLPCEEDLAPPEDPNVIYVDDDEDYILQQPEPGSDGASEMCGAVGHNVGGFLLCIDPVQEDNFIDLTVDNPVIGRCTIDLTED